MHRKCSGGLQPLPAPSRRLLSPCKHRWGLAAPRPLQQTSFSDATPSGYAARGKFSDPPPPEPVGSQSEIPQRMPSSLGAPAPTTGTMTPAQETWGTDVSHWVGGPGDPVPGAAPCGDGCEGGACCDGGACCGGLRGWFTRHCCGPTPSCSDACGDGCCAPRPIFWASAEYLLWTVRNASTPPLVTVNNTGALPVVGVPGTTVAVGGAQDYDIRSGGKFTMGFGLPCLGNVGLETTYFFLGDRTTEEALSSKGVPSIGRPFINVGPQLSGFPGNQDAELVAFPGLVAGGIAVKTTSSLWGIEENVRLPIACGPTYKVDFLAGFRFLQLDESLQITENLAVAQPGGGTSNIVVVDRFHTRNDFYGGQVGFDTEWNFWRRWYLGGAFKLALGDMHEEANIDGSTFSSLSGSQRGGLLALNGTNIGRYGQDRFAVLPEAEFKIGYNFTSHLRGYVGYDVIYASSAVRPGDQFSTLVNPTFIPGNGPAQGAALPSYPMHTTDFWAQGVTFGLEWRW